MTGKNIWDQTGRYAIRLDPPGFYEWTLRLPRSERYFTGWADTRNVPYPAGRDRIWDTVACFANLEAGGEPWAVITEVQSDPDPLILGRYNVYGGSLWQDQKPDPEPGSRFLVSGLVINLTGGVSTMRSKSWPRTRLRSLSGPTIFNVAKKLAATAMKRIETGELGLAILPWIPLMRGGNKTDIIQRWKVMGEQEPDRRKKSDYGALALLFAEKAACRQIWHDYLEDWNMEESVVLKEWTERAELRGEKRGEKRGKVLGEKKGLLEMIAVFLEHRFGAEGLTFAKQLQQVNDLDTLHAVGKGVTTAGRLDDLRALLNP